MKVLCGIDVIEVDRINQNLDKKEFKNRVYTKIEIEYCDARKLQAAESYAARFAVKEAFSKAIGTGITEGVSLKDIEVIRTDGKPQIKLYNKALEILKEMGFCSIDVSVSHIKELAIASVVILINDQKEERS